ncbi:hypothetical protein [Aquabacterium sp. A08]|uniref:hypothetical protein n=1 Tax=Aquabacterium sp. A08 TaxID=2718532 RepID=UPI00141DD16B|nr:hypothetical protein [Aquabacterium sp. A08]NIC41382.1 hypothetical protein [Aquabacterium sp. A08]NIC41429.1 hypothetical protein [Aquabacterium sp. A08]
MSVAVTAPTASAPASLRAGRLGRGLRGAALGLACASALWLGGCAGVIRLDNDVQSYPRWPAQAAPAAGDRFRIERLPSQTRAAPEQTQLEGWVAERLVAAGLVPTSADAPQGARWSVEVSARSLQMPHAPWEHPVDRWPGPGLAGRDYVVTGSGRLVRLPPFAGMAPPYYQREVAVLLRDTRTGVVAYETRAAHDGPWHDTPVLWQALVQAALDGFPQPPTGPRRVVIDVPR